MIPCSGRLRRAFINPFNVILFVLGCISLVMDGFLASDFSKNATTALIIFSMILISGGSVWCRNCGRKTPPSA